MIINADSREFLKLLPSDSVDSIVTDPPYEIGFMGKSWDRSGVAFDKEMWSECLRVLKPGGHALVFGATRTSHRVATALEDSGFEIRDTIIWLYSSGFPKSLDLSKAIDSALGVTRPVVGSRTLTGSAATNSGKSSCTSSHGLSKTVDVTAPGCEESLRWEGWGTALKPSHEPIVVARKPIVGTVATNVLAYGTGGMNVGACRVPYDTDADRARIEATARSFADTGGLRGNILGVANMPKRNPNAAEEGRWPPNILVSEEVSAELGQQGVSFPSFHYCPKAGVKEREKGCEHLPLRTSAEMVDREPGSDGMNSPRAGAGRTSGRHNDHTTVKPLELVRWLVKLVTPKGGTVLDPFAGSGTTAIAAALEGAESMCIELDAHHCEIAEARVAGWTG